MIVTLQYHYYYKNWIYINSVSCQYSIHTEVTVLFVQQPKSICIVHARKPWKFLLEIDVSILTCRQQQQFAVCFIRCSWMLLARHFVELPAFAVKLICALLFGFLLFYYYSQFNFIEPLKQQHIVVLNLINLNTERERERLNNLYIIIMN